MKNYKNYDDENGNALSQSDFEKYIPQEHENTWQPWSPEDEKHMADIQLQRYIGRTRLAAMESHAKAIDPVTNAAGFENYMTELIAERENLLKIQQKYEALKRRRFRAYDIDREEHKLLDATRHWVHEAECAEKYGREARPEYWEEVADSLAYIFRLIKDL